MLQNNAYLEGKGVCFSVRSQVQQQETVLHCGAVPEEPEKFTAQNAPVQVQQCAKTVSGRSGLSEITTKKAPGKNFLLGALLSY